MSRRDPHSATPTRHAWNVAEEERIDYRWLDLMGRDTRGLSRKAYRHYVESMLSKDDAEYLEEEGKSRYVIGDERAREQAAEELRGKRLERTVTGDIVWPEDDLPDIGKVEEAVLKVLGVTANDLRSHGHRLGVLKTVAVELCCRCSGTTQRAVAQRFGYRHESAVGKARRVARVALAKDKRLAAKAARIEKMARTIKC